MAGGGLSAGFPPFGPLGPPSAADGLEAAAWFESSLAAPARAGRVGSAPESRVSPRRAAEVRPGHGLAAPRAPSEPAMDGGQRDIVLQAGCPLF